MSEYGCKYREWDWHDGGPDFKCTFGGRINWCCENSYDNFYANPNCVIITTEDSSGMDDKILE